MGNASKWIRDFLIGKKEEKYKQIDGAGQRGSEVESPKVKRRWSFGRRRGKVAEHRLSTSSDLTDSAKLQIQAILQTGPPNTLPIPFSDIENAAATKIQAAFRSYLGRKALHALRGLVKLQALLRGYLVRKQTATTLRNMHALMTIQVRARIHRIQMARGSNLLGKQLSQIREIPPNKGHIREYKDPKDMSLREMLEVLRSRSDPLDGPPRKSIELDSMTLSSKHLSVSKRDRRYTAPNSAEDYLAMSGLNPTKGLSTSLRHHQSYSWEPNYMTKTESSRAKARAESEPKQRPKRGMRHNNKPIESLDGRRQYMSSNSTRFNKLYG